MSLPHLVSGSVFHDRRKDIMDERYAAVDVLGKGLVVFSA